MIYDENHDSNIYFYAMINCVLLIKLDDKLQYKKYGLHIWL